MKLKIVARRTAVLVLDALKYDTTVEQRDDPAGGGQPLVAS